jgi:hypothetical protein
MSQVKQILNHAYFLKDHGSIDDYINFLEESYKNLKSSKEDIWEIVKLIAEHSILSAKNYEKNKMQPGCFAELNRALKVLYPINPRWKEKIEWQVLRLNVFSNLAEYYRRYYINRESKTIKMNLKYGQRF